MPDWAYYAAGYALISVALAVVGWWGRRQQRMLGVATGSLHASKSKLADPEDALMLKGVLTAVSHAMQTAGLVAPFERHLDRSGHNAGPILRPQIQRLREPAGD